LEGLALAFVEIEEEVGFEDVVAGGELEEMSGLVDGAGRSLKFDEGADGGFVVVDEEILSPFETGGKTEGSAKFLVSEPAAEAEAFEDFLEGGGFGEDGLEFFADLMAAVGRRSGGADGELFGRGFESKEEAGGSVFGGGLLPCRGFCADAEELAVLGKAAVRRVKEEVVLVDTRRDGFGT